MNILYLEDNEMHAELTRITLSDTAPDFDLHIATTVAQARQKIASDHYDAALIDMRLPDGTGIEFIASVRQYNTDLPMVVLTSMDDEITTVSALKAGADDYLVKFGNYLQRLPDVVHSAIERHQNSDITYMRSFNVIYVEHYETDAELTRRHISQYAPHIKLNIVRSSGELLKLFDKDAECELQCDVLLMDYRLPGLNALEIVEELRSRHAFDIPVILITGQGSVDIAVQALRMGAVDYAVKQKGYLTKLPAMLENAYHLAQLEHQRANLQLALEDQHRLTRELFHRTRNNMQIIHAIIEGKSLLLDNPQTVEILQSIQQRVKSLALVQEILNQNHHLSMVSLNSCLEQLCSVIQRQHYIPDSQIHLVQHFEAVDVFIDIAQPCCMILTELLMNVYQHAYPDRRKGTVNITLQRSGGHELTLSISDDGVGVQDDFNLRTQQSYGLQSVVMMVEYQLQGSIVVETAKGFSYTITLRDDLYEARI